MTIARNRQTNRSGKHMETIATLVSRHRETFTRKERQIARVLTSGSLIDSLATVAEFARSANTSTATILRFASKLGFGNYSEFQDHLREELSATLESPLARYQSSTEPRGDDDAFTRYADWSVQVMRQTRKTVPLAEFRAIVDVLGNMKASVYVIGGRFSRSLAEWMCFGLSGIRPNVYQVHDDMRQMVDVLMSLTRQDVVIAFDFRRHQESIIRFCDAVSKTKATLVIITDQWQSPSARNAHYVLALPVASPSIFDSALAPLMCVEALISHLAERQGERTEKRARMADDLYSTLAK